MTPTQLADPVQAVLAGKYFDSGEPLRAAWQWTRSGNADQIEWARQLLAFMTDPANELDDAGNGYGWLDLDSLAVWYERAFNRVKAGQHDDALRLFVDEIGPRFGTVLNADALSLWGRLHKDRGDAARKRDDYAGAEKEYKDAEAKYELSYRQHRDRFPGINVATLRLLRAACLARGITSGRTDTQDLDEAHARQALIADLRDGSKRRAAEVLASRPWPKWLADDDIWIAATAAEAFVLQEKWADAEVQYRMALRPENTPLPHHSDSMAAQLERLNDAFRALGVTVPSPFDSPREFLASLLTKK